VEPICRSAHSVIFHLEPSLDRLVWLYDGIDMSNYRVFGANQSINSYLAAMSRHQGWFEYFSATPVGRQARQKGVKRKSL